LGWGVSLSYILKLSDLNNLTIYGYTKKFLSSSYPFRLKQNSFQFAI